MGSVMAPLSGVLPTPTFVSFMLTTVMVLLMVNKLLYAYASHFSITYRCSSVQCDFPTLSKLMKIFSRNLATAKL